MSPRRLPVREVGGGAVLRMTADASGVRPRSRTHCAVRPALPVVRRRLPLAQAPRRRALRRSEGRGQVHLPVRGRLLAGGDVALDALAGFVLGDPAGVDDDVQVVLGDRQSAPGRPTACATPFGPPLKVVTPSISVDRLAAGELDGDFGGTLAEFAACPSRPTTVCVPSATRLSAALSPSWPVTGTVPARPWASRAATDAAGRAVVLGDDRVDLVVVGGQELLHVLLGVLGLPAVGDRLRRRS